MSLQAKYTEEQRAVALAFYDACGQNLREAARKSDIPLSTLQRWVKGGATNEDVYRKRDIVKGELAEKLERLAHQIADAMPGKIGSASLAASATSLAIAVDKVRLLRDQPTSIDSQRTIRIEYADAPHAGQEGRRADAHPAPAPSGADEDKARSEQI